MSCTTLIVQWMALLTTVLGGDQSEVTSLSELPLERLLHVKRALTEGFEIANDDLPETEDIDVPAAMALRGDLGRLRGRKNPPYRRGYVEVEDGWKAKGKGDIQSIFQMTITALAFLAFGGYLICMIIAAIKASNQQMMTTTMTMTTMAPAIVAARRHRRAANSNRHHNVTNNMFNALQTLAEGYNKYNQHCQHVN